MLSTTDQLLIRACKNYKHLDDKRIMTLHRRFWLQCAPSDEYKRQVVASALDSIITKSGHTYPTWKLLSEISKLPQSRTYWEHVCIVLGDHIRWISNLDLVGYKIPSRFKRPERS